MSTRKSILLIHPPVSKPCESPAGLALLSGALAAAGVDCRVADFNLECAFDLLHAPVIASGTWSRRAVGSIQANLAALRSPALYENRDRYKRAVMDVNRVLHIAGQASNVNISLSNYSSPDLSPVRSVDLLLAAERFEENPFFFSFEQRLTSLFSVKLPDIVGLSVNFMSQAMCAFAMAGFVRKWFPGIRIVMGGGLITSWMQIPGFGNPFAGLIDDLVSGAGESPLLAMCGADIGARPPGVIYDYSGFPVGQYLSPVPVIPFITARGCYWRKCRFCPERAEGSAYHPQRLPGLSGELDRLTGQRRSGLIHFLDNALPPKFLKSLIVNPPGLPWYGFVRITEHLTDMDFVRGLKKSGCVMLKLGVESGDQRVLAALEKGMNLSTASKTLHTLKAAGIAAYVYLLFGTPAEDLGSARKTLDFTLDHADAIDFLNLAVFNLPAYSDDARSLETVDFYEGDLSLYREFIHPRGWNRDRVRQFLAKEFTRPAPIRRIIGNDPPFFTSNHAAFLVSKG
ncbi:MAG: radical SAM protein [Desulfobacteraceae bacterium]|nr:radical SAM protein [Desulfobacteraceae bacterium]